MKKLLSLLALAFVLVFSKAQAQDVSINVLSVPAQLTIGESGYVLVEICNQDASPVSAPTNRLRPLVSLPSLVEITGVTNGDGSPLTNFQILDQSTTSLMMLYQPALPNPECVSYRIQIKAVSVGTLETITGTLGFQGPQPPRNNPANDNSTTGIAVVDAPTPVTLASFTAKKEGLSAQLSWVTIQEKNTKSFEVEHSLDGRSWRNLGSVAAVGNSTTEQRYSYLDTDPANGLNYYRLRMVDFDGHTELSRSQSLSFERGLQANVYPNPAVDYLTLDVKDASKVQNVQILSSTGKAVYESATPAAQVKVSSLTKGLYLVRFQFKNGSMETYKVIKQ
ncbi:T9SS type A sorting domain-containing protein [Siphonobacter sp.]|uniref:T9SS type A sorting domain-containing protein n=1 Tax=Siphonobacter sp. TaxID=1869184 RepID=UPI003B39FE53